jgi:hypothetical protein
VREELITMLRTAFLIGLVATTVLTSAARAQAPTAYNLSTEGFITGTIQEVQQNDLCRVSRDGSCNRCDCCDGTTLCQGVHIVLKTGARKLDVYVAPWWFVNQSEFTFEAGQQVVVLGSRVQLPMGTLMLAREITVAGDTYRLRDVTGRPVWVQRFTN